LVIAVMVLAVLWPSTRTRAFQQPLTPTFRSGTLGVRVDVLVTDGRKPVAGLTAEDFDLRDNGVPQAIKLVDAAAVPLNVVLALDVSASVTGARERDLIAASEALLDGFTSIDRAALTTFNQAVQSRIPLTGDLTSIRQALHEIEPSGHTALLDGVYVAVAGTLTQPGRSLIVVCTDGSDVSSWLRTEDVLQSATRSNAVIYGVVTRDAARATALEALTEASGGEVLRVASSAALRDAFRKILETFRQRYVLAYTPAGVPSGGFHRLDVRVKRRGLTVKTRPGYLGVEATK
jgi:VWFA-related protein